MNAPGETSDTRAPGPPPGPPGPGSVCWQQMGRWAVLSIGARALVLQAAHPVVGAGLHEHSSLQTDLLPRLVRTITSIQRVVYTPPQEAAAEARRLRALHARIRGTDSKGRPYHALEPHAYAWVHATLFEGVITYGALSGRRLSLADQKAMYGEWLAVGQVLGLGRHDLPASLDGFWDYFRTTVEDQLEDNQAVRDLLGRALLHSPPPGRVPPALWQALWPPLARRAARLTLTTLPLPYLHRLGVTVTDRQHRRTRRLYTCIAAAERLLPERHRYLPLAAVARRSSVTIQP
ncbi:oxygenase MpaB family protein [Streptomyces aureoversilis]|uniref:Oxygenase MpaB family protein n=1 Tax=Streptomyces aureoversilis TaxID=67277 RepID=A0ABV9ZTN5_9ACTN